MRMAKTSGDYLFQAFRRGRLKEDLVIKGRVLGPPEAEPYLVPEFEARPKNRGFRLAFRNNSDRLPFVIHEFEQVIPKVPDFVDFLRIHLPNEEIFTIDRARRPR